MKPKGCDECISVCPWIGMLECPYRNTSHSAKIISVATDVKAIEELKKAHDDMD